jgi:hypothetical protein
MKCNEYNQQLYTDPSRLSDAARAHLEDCVDCVKETDQVLAMESDLQDSARVDAPGGLSERVLARQSMHSNSRMRAKAPWFVALAASVLLAFGALQMRTPGLPVAPELPHAVISQVMAQTVSAEVMQTTVSDNEVRMMFAAVGGQLSGDIGPVNRCSLTKINGHDAAIMVVKGDAGPVYVVYVVGQKVPKRAPVTQADMHGIIWPDKKGTIAIIGNSDEAKLPQIEESIKRNVTWI